MLRYLVRDWARAPVSGTVVIVAMGASIYAALWLGNLDGALLWLIISQLNSIQRGPMPPEEK